MDDCTIEGVMRKVVAEQAYIGPGASLASACKAETDMDRAIREAQVVGKMARELRAEIGGFLDRVRGERPEANEGCEDCQDFGAGALGTVRRTIDSARAALGDAIELARELQTIA